MIDPLVSETPTQARRREAEERRARATSLIEQGRVDEAVACLEETVALDPDIPESHCHLGIALRCRGRFGAALACFDKAIALKSDYAEAHANKGILLLLAGDYERGWKQYEWRWKTKDNKAHWPKVFQPLWDGADLSGKTILLYGEQGFGDTIQFIRYASLVATQARAGRIILACQPALLPLVAALPAISKVIPDAFATPPFQVARDVTCPLMNLPSVFGTTLETIPAAVPYLAPDPKLQAGWRARLERGGELAVGLVWAGNPEHSDDRNRSIALAALAPVLRTPGVRFYGLQIGARAQDIRTAGFADAIEDLSDGLTDFAHTAAAISLIDLVIAVDTSVAHLAGALSRPVWVMLPWVPDWRWMLERTDCPWYPTMRLFRQPGLGDWAPVVERVRAELAALAGASR